MIFTSLFFKDRIQTLILDDNERFLHILNLDWTNFRRKKNIITKETRRLCTNAWVEFGVQKSLLQKRRFSRFDLCFVVLAKGIVMCVFVAFLFFSFTCHKNALAHPVCWYILVFQFFLLSLLHLIQIESKELCYWIFHICCHRSYFSFYHFNTRSYKPGFNLMTFHFLFRNRISLLHERNTQSVRVFITFTIFYLLEKKKKEMEMCSVLLLATFWNSIDKSYRRCVSQQQMGER